MRALPVFAITLVPRDDFISWVHKTCEFLELEDVLGKKELSYDEIQQDCPVFIVPAQEDKAAFTHYLNTNYQRLMVNYFRLWAPDHRLWPFKSQDEVTMELFEKYFAVELHTWVVDIDDKDEK